MYKANIKVTVTTFRKTNGEFGPDKPKDTPYVDAYLSDLRDISAQPSATPVFVLTGKPGEEQTLHVRVPRNYKNGAQINYQLPDNRYVMLGIAFTPMDTTDKDVGQAEFPLVSMNRDSDSSEMTVTDMCEERADGRNAFTYGVLIQEVATGNIGIYDPMIINEPHE